MMLLLHKELLVLHAMHQRVHRHTVLLLQLLLHEHLRVGGG